MTNDLTMNLDSHSEEPLYEQIYHYIKREIQNGGLPFKERLPSTRKLAEYLQVSRTTVDMAYQQLVSEGYIEASPCRGYFVCELEGLYRLKPARMRGQALRAEPETPVKFDLSPTGVDLNSFPQNAWRKLSKEILLTEDPALFQLGDPQGDPGLRQTIAVYLHQARGVQADAGQIVVGAGNDFLLLLLFSLFGPGQKIAMESPTYKRAYDLLSNLTNEIRIVEMDELGLRVDCLEQTDAQFAYVMPSHQFPLGTVMPMKRRMQLLAWAQAGENRFIIEDDYDSEFRYRGKPIPALQGSDRSGRVIYIGTFSRSIAPAIRVSYMVLPEGLLDLYAQRGRAVSSTVSRVDQLLIARFLNDGYFERHLNRMRAIYRGRHDLLLEKLKEFRSVCRISGENAGVHLLLTFTDGRTEEEAIRAAAAQGVHVCGLSGYYVGEVRAPGEATVLLGYAKLTAQEMEEAVGRLKKAWLRPDPAEG